MLIKTSELTGAALDWAVATAEKRNPVLTSDMRVNGVPAMFADDEDDLWCPSISWGQGGPLIDKYSIQLSAPLSCCIAGVQIDREAFAYAENGTVGGTKPMAGKTTLEAVCRVVVYRHLGEEVEIPDALFWAPSIL